MSAMAKSDCARIHCPVCGGKYSRTRGQQKAGKKNTCSRRCSYILRGRQRIKRQAVVCAKCGRPFEKPPSAINQKNFCAKCKSFRTVPYPAGHRCGRWIVLSAYVLTRKGERLFQKCRCECGAEHYVRKACLNPDAVNSSLGCRKCSQARKRKTLPKEAIEQQLASGAQTLAAIARTLSSNTDIVRNSIERHSIVVPQGFGPQRTCFLPGDCFGKWTVMGKPFTRCSPSGTPLRYVKCRCECGAEKPLRLSHLTERRSTQCRKCMGKERRAENSPHWKGNELISGALMNVFRSGARSRDLEWVISADDMSKQFELQKGRCALSGVPLSLPVRDYARDDGCGIHYEGNASLDRIDSTRGYTTDNIQWVEKTVNLMKRDFTEHEFISLCRLASGRKPAFKETTAAFEERFLSGLWSRKKREGIFSPHWKGCGAITGSRYHRIRVNATSRGIAFRLTCEQVWRIFIEQRGRCAITGLPLVLHTKNADTQWNASLDRIDSQGPYTPENVWWVDLRINLLKRELSLQEVLARCCRVSRYRKATHKPAALSAPNYKHGFRRT
jgi:hypothetical protein